MSKPDTDNTEKETFGPIFLMNIKRQAREEMQSKRNSPTLLGAESEGTTILGKWLGIIYLN